MKTCVFLILLDFIHIVFCNQDLNVTENDLYSVCPVKLFRRKRAYAEYTRWRTNQETSPEFIVKVLDEDLTTPNLNPIYAVNIQPVTKRDERIVIGGAMVSPLQSTELTTGAAADYTRFVPPTAATGAPRHASNNVAPGPIPGRGNHPGARHSQRDEGPPAGPQFIERTPPSLARQYAPIEPVAFTLRATMAPMTPSLSSPYNVQKVITPPTRTSPLPDLMRPTRTKSDIEDFRKFQGYGEDTIHPEPAFLTRSTYVKIVPVRSSPMLFDFTTANEYDSASFINKFIKENRRREEESLKTAEKETDSLYNIMFYSEENEVGEKKDFHDDFEKNKNQEDLSEGINDTMSEISRNNDESKNDTEMQEINSENDIRLEYEVKNITNVPRKGVVSIPDIDVVTFRSLNEKSRDKRRPLCNLLKIRPLNFNSPRTLPEIISQLKRWADDSPVVKWVDITDGNLTTMENPIHMMIVDDPSSGQIVTAKQTVMIVAGIQGSDHRAVAAAMYILYQLVERSEAHADLLSKYRFWIIPVFNPDGYDYSMTFPQRREWAKNLHQFWDACKGRESCRACATHGVRCTAQACYGVNLDRNFEYQWIPAEELRSEHPCGPLYAGERQLSELETSALTHHLHKARAPISTFIAFKEGDVLGVMYPYSHTRKKRAFDHIYRQRAARGAAAAHSVAGRAYVAGQTSQFLPLYAGGIEDWMDGHLGIDNTYTVMMFRPSDSYDAHLVTERVVHEAYAAMDTLLLQSAGPLAPPARTLAAAGAARAGAVPAHRLRTAVAAGIMYHFTCYITFNL